MGNGMRRFGLVVCLDRSVGNERWHCNGQIIQHDIAQSEDVVEIFDIFWVQDPVWSLIITRLWSATLHALLFMFETRCRHRFFGNRAVLSGRGGSSDRVAKFMRVAQVRILAEAKLATLTHSNSASRSTTLWSFIMQ